MQMRRRTALGITIDKLSLRYRDGGDRLDADGLLGHWRRRLTVGRAIVRLMVVVPIGLLVRDGGRGLRVLLSDGRVNRLLGMVRVRVHDTARLASIAQVR